MQSKDRRLVTERNLENYTESQLAPVKHDATTARAEAHQALTTSQSADTKSDNAVFRVEQVETIAGLAPGEVTDAQTANLIQQPDSSTRGAFGDALAAEISASDSNGRQAVNTVLENSLAPLRQTVSDANFTPSFDPLAASLQLGEVIDMPVSPYGHRNYVHPSVVRVPGGWNGYQYWMAITPLPSGGGNQEENPCIYASHDGYTWVEPAGITNPISPPPPEDGAYNADTELVLHDGTMYCFYTVNWTRDEQGRSVYKTVYKTSSDGVTWSDEQICYSYPRDERRFFSPAIIPIDDVWHVFAVDTITTKIIHMHGPSASGPWSKPVYGDLYSPLPDGREAWHITVAWSGNEWHMLLNDTTAGASGAMGALYFYRSSDAEHWTGGKRVAPIVGSDYAQFYRSAWVYSQAEGKPTYDVWANVFSHWSGIRRFMRRGRLTFNLPTVEERFAADLQTARVGQPPFLVWDDFARPNGELGSTPGGSTWEAVTSGAGAVIDQGLVKAVSNDSLYAVDTGESDVYVEAKIRGLGSSPGGMVVARASTNESYVAFGWSQNSLQFAVVNNGNGVANSARPNRPYSFGLEDEPIIIGLRVVGREATGFVNGEQAGDPYIIPSNYTQLIQNTMQGIGVGRPVSDANLMGDFLVRKLS